jgi:hypothetical protein
MVNMRDADCKIPALETEAFDRRVYSCDPGEAAGLVVQSASRMFNEAEASRMAYSRNIDSVGSRTPTSPVQRSRYFSSKPYEKPPPR